MYEKNIQMYDKNTHTKSHTSVLKKHAYKCIKKTTHTNTHTNVWKKRVQMYEKNMHTNV